MTPPLARVLERTWESPRTGDPAGPAKPGAAPRPGLVQTPGRHLAAVTLAVIRREWLAGVFGGSAIFAAVTALISSHAAERLWGDLAAVSYCAAAVSAA